MLGLRLGEAFGYVKSMWLQMEMTKEITEPADWRFCKSTLILESEGDNSVQKVRRRKRGCFDVSIQGGSIRFCVCTRVRGCIRPPIRLGWLLKERTMYF